MADDSLDELMLRWETARQQGQDLSPEELCGDRPQLADPLRRRMRAILAMEQLLGVIDHDPLRTMSSLSGSGTGAATADAMPTIPGYEIKRVIDQGGMGVVYEARDSKLGRTVAIKMISALFLRPKVLTRFRMEAEVLAALQHPGFVQIFEIGEIGGRPYFSMEYMPGASLAQRLTQGPMSARNAAELVQALARAVLSAHERGIVHRDLKPSNVMFTADGAPKIADFGLAKRLDDDSGHTHTGEILGTPSYMAPEQAEGKKDEIGPATDVYALGAILYEMLAGRPPFQGTSPLDSLRQVVALEPIPPTRINSQAPRDLEAICLKCLEKSSGDRYASAKTLAEDLGRFLNGQPVMARRVGPIQRTWKAMRRHPQAVALVGLLVLLAAIPLYYLAAQFHAQTEIRRRAREAAPLVREILERNCHECHGHNPKKTEKNLDILNYEHLLAKERHIVVPGKPEDSLLIQRIIDGSMPPAELEESLPRVNEKELTILRDWIIGGAPPLPAGGPQHGDLTAAPYSELAAKTKEIFHFHCYECHKHDVAKGGIRIMHHRQLVNERKVVVPGQPADSKLYQRLITDDPKRRMPPDDEGIPLTQEQIDTVRAWIAEGALPFPKTKK